jgi:predicted porin
MHRTILFVSIAVLALGGASDALAAESEAKTKAKGSKKAKSGHDFKGTLEGQFRTNSNIGLAPSSGRGFDFAQLSEFAEDESDEAGGDEEEEEDDDSFDSLVDEGFDEDEIEEEDAIDEDGDGVDDLIDPNADNRIDSENRFTTKLGLKHKYVFEDGAWSWNNGIKLAQDTHADRSDLDKLNYAVSTGFEFAPKGSKHKFAPSISWVTLEKDNGKFASTFVASLDYEYEVSKRLSVGATYNYQDKDIANPDSPDARIDTFAIGVDFKATKDDIFKLKYAPKVEDSTQVTRNTDAYGWEVTYTRKLPWDMTAGLGYKFDSVDHKNLTPRRKDDNRTWAVQVTKDFGKRFSTALGYETRERSSNIPNKDAENDSFYLEGTWKF